MYCMICGQECRHPDSHMPVRLTVDPPDIGATLAERGNRYGVFAHQAEIAQKLKDVMREAPGWERLAPDMKEALDMECNKNARILNGDPNFHDSWHDKVGYNKLVADRISVLSK